MITATLASFAERRAPMLQAVQSLLPQVDRVQVYLNDYPDVPQALVEDPRVRVYRSQNEIGDLNDAGKFYRPPQEGFHLVCDDDLIYPPDFAGRMTAGAQAHQGVVGLHGVTIHPTPISSYYRDRDVVHGLAHTLEEPMPCHLVATCSMCYHTDLIRFTIADFPAPAMADIWAGRKCQREGVPVVCLPHRSGWVKQNPSVDLNRTIYRWHKDDDGVQTHAVNTMTWEVRV